MLLESIRLYDGQLPYFEWHLQRMHNSRKALWGLTNKLSPDIIRDQTAEHTNGLYKVRVLYSDRIHQVEIHPYVIRQVNTLQLLDASGLQYDHKYADRQMLQQLAAQKGTADDVLFFADGFISDTSYCNIALYDGNGWHTPAVPLLPGVQRSRLLLEQQISPYPIRLQDIYRYQKIKLINAMMSWEESPELPVSKIIAPESIIALYLV